MKISLRFLRLAALLALFGGYVSAQGAVSVYAEGEGKGWDRYVEYLHRLANTVQSDYAQQLSHDASAQRPQGEVVVRMTVDRHGTVDKILDMEATNPVGADQVKALEKAVTVHGAYGAWPEAMALDLGDERTVQVDFCFPASHP